MATTTRYPTSVDGGSWQNANAVKIEGGSTASFPDAATDNLQGTGFGFTESEVPDDKAITSVVLGVKASSVAAGGKDPAIDEVRLIIDGEVAGESQGHGNGIWPGYEEPPQWYESTLYPSDLTAIGLTPEQVRCSSFGMLVCFYDRQGSETGSAEVFVDAIRITVNRQD